MHSDLKRVIIATALAAASFNAAAHVQPTQPTLAVRNIDERLPMSYEMRPSRIRIERCPGRTLRNGDHTRFAPLIML